MVGFISHAGAAVQPNIMTILPVEVRMPQLPYAQELSESLDEMKSAPEMSDKLEGVNMPDLTSMQTVKFNMNSTDSNFELPAEILTMLQSSDVTTIKEDIKVFSSTMFDLMTPDVIVKIQGGIQSGITGMEEAVTGIDQGLRGYNQPSTRPRRLMLLVVRPQPFPLRIAKQIIRFRISLIR